MLLTSLPFDYVMLADGKDRPRSTWRRPSGARIRRPSTDKD